MFVCHWIVVLVVTLTKKKKRLFVFVLPICVYTYVYLCQRHYSMISYFNVLIIYSVILFIHRSKNIQIHPHECLVWRQKSIWNDNSMILNFYYSYNFFLYFYLYLLFADPMSIGLIFIIKFIYNFFLVLPIQLNTLNSKLMDLMVYFHFI